MAYESLLLIVMLSCIGASFQYEEDNNILYKKQDQEKTLLAFKNQIISDPRRSLANWIPTEHTFCNWTGIMCNKDMNTVIALNLTGMDLIGPLPHFLQNLSDLQVLNLSQNNFYGQIPYELVHLKRLQILNLAENSLNGTIPEFVSSLSSLSIFDVSGNEIRGSIPSELGLLVNLEVLNLAQNRLTGVIPVALSNMSSIRELKVYHNYLSGEIPWEFCMKMSKLETLLVWENQLSGRIPNSIGNCSKLTKFIANDNLLTGTIPDDFGKIKSLLRLKVQNNQLISGNHNSFITALANCSSLEQLAVGDNSLSSNLPTSIGRLSKKLSRIYMTENSFSGRIPSEIGNLTGLNFLALNRNSFEGRVPSELGALVDMERLQLQRNKLQGKIPESLAKLNHLGILDLSSNMLSGEIPDFIGSLSQLRYLMLNNNNLSGSIPSSLGYSSNLALLDLSYNLLSGVIPREVGRLSSLQLYLNISSNQLQGQLPREIGGLNMVQAIDISNNRLQGHIPEQIVSCVALQALNLSVNSFNGSIPRKIGELENLVVLDLSSNKFSGKIPVSALEGLEMLHYLNLSFNNIIGDIGDRDFQKANVSVFLEGNPGLCGNSELKLGACPKSSNHISRLLKLILPTLFIIILLCFCCAFLIIPRINGNMRVSRLEYQNSREQELFYREIFKATDGFSESNLLGSGSFGSVYKGVLPDNSVVAIKVINLQKEEIKSSFIAESNVLRNVKHRNLVKFIRSVSTPKFKGLVFDLMSNGSLEDNLYQGGNNMKRGLCKLGLQTRLNIAADVSHALEYLHHDCFIQVVHCDIKPANVLLDEDMTAHLTDFGISKLINETAKGSSGSIGAMRGTMGYIPPEYGLGDIISTTRDVYSFGVLLLELFTRKKPTCEMFVGGLTLPSWVSMSFPNRIENIIDVDILGEIEVNKIDKNKAFECLSTLFYICLLCTNEASQARPDMRSVSRRLEKLRQSVSIMR